MNGFVANIEEKTKNNTNFREVLFTAPHSQLVVMSLLPGEEIGVEVHNVDQFFRFESGSAKVEINGEAHNVTDGYAVIVPAGCTHNIINIGNTTLKLYTIYSPANHKEGIIHVTKEAAEAAEQE